MKEITVKFSDKLFAAFQSDIALKGMCGSLYGIPDEVCVKVIKAIRDNEGEVELSYKTEKTYKVKIEKKTRKK